MGKKKKKKREKNHITCLKGTGEAAMMAAAHSQKQKEREKKHWLAFLYSHSKTSAP